MSSKIVKEGLTFDDVLLIPQASDVRELFFELFSDHRFQPKFVRI